MLCLHTKYKSEILLNTTGGHLMLQSMQNYSSEQNIGEFTFVLYPDF